MSKYLGVVGIDLGTTNSVVTKIDRRDNLEVIKNKEGDKITPSFIWVKEDEETGKISYNVGRKARDKMSTDPINVLSSYKPHIGSDKVIKELSGKPFTAQHSSYLALKYMKEGIMEETGSSTAKAVITVPAYFNENQKSSTMLAAKMAGIDVLGIIPEPTASALYYTHSKDLPDEGKVVLVYDIGGGTFDVSIVHVMEDNATVMAIDGNRFLGGDDFDKALEFMVVTEAGLTGKLSETQSEILTRRAETAKVNLMTKAHEGTGNPREQIKVDDLGGPAKPIIITLKQFEELTQNFVDRTLECVDNAMGKIELTTDMIDEVILVGGSSRLTGVRKALTAKFDGRFDDEYFNTYLVDPDLAVSAGAAIYAKMIVDKEEGKVSNTLPMSLGIENNKGDMSVILREGTIFPTQNNRSFATTRDNQEIMEIDIYEGNAKTAKNNTLIGSLEVPVPPNTLKEKYSVIISFKMSADGILDVRVIGNTVQTLTIVRGAETDMENIEDDEIFDIHTDEEEEQKQEKPTIKAKPKATKATKSTKGGKAKTKAGKKPKGKKGEEKKGEPKSGLLEWEE